MFRRQNIKTINYVFGFRRNLTIENWEQLQNFPQLVIKFILENIRTDTMVAGSNLSWQGIKRKAVYTEGAGLVCKCTGQCTLEGSVQGGASA